MRALNMIVISMILICVLILILKRLYNFYHDAFPSFIRCDCCLRHAFLLLLCFKHRITFFSLSYSYHSTVKSFLELLVHIEWIDEKFRNKEEEDYTLCHQPYFRTEETVIVRVLGRDDACWNCYVNEYQQWYNENTEDEKLKGLLLFFLIEIEDY